MATGGLYRNPNAFDMSPEEGVTAPYRLPAGSMKSGQKPMTSSLTLDTRFFDLPIPQEGGPLAQLCYLAAYCYVERHGTQGYIPAGAVGTLTDWEQLGVTGREAAERCCRAGMMERSGGGYRLLAYHTPVR